MNLRGQVAILEAQVGDLSLNIGEVIDCPFFSLSFLGETEQFVASIWKGPEDYNNKSL